MGVFRDIEMEYDGKSYTVTPSNRLLRKIEGELSPSSLTDMIARIGSAKPPVSEVAFVVSEFLKAGGAEKVDEDQMYVDLMGDLMSNEGKVFAAMTEALVVAISPVDAPAKKQKPSKAKSKE
ncbi:MAG: hypothetical protein GOVbin4685_10 [Prokaryotic dsDNA virus sp.]|mgnify:CR=1 FL=1|jgi:hypothetical protein|nr:MAG: hypothetical protein GOVbin4685_10 [Prokaryotic dsDNA virus sp.]|tara:strand:- start:10816 stop:11181 length:366 start_codon:yes stop_codon:yes gene_type:complete